MGTPPSDDVAEIARRRLQALRLELSEHASVPPARQEGAPPSALPESGRHARSSIGTGARLAAWSSEHVPATLRGRVRLGGREVMVLVGILGLALAVAGWLALRSDDSAPVAAASPATSPPTALATPAARASTSGGTIVIDVAGKVRRPGVFTLPTGARVIDALRKAGGANKRVDLTGINLARVLNDGEQVLVGRAVAGGVAAGAAASAGEPATGALLSLNTATVQQLEALPGVGPVTAEKIMSWREAHGAFTSVDELLEVDGIGEKTLADLAPLVTL